ncbi:MAG: EF-hand domain-containing protein [Paracoccaceae bacterium]
MIRFTLATALGLASAGAALAAGTLADLDADKSGGLSLTELQAVYTKLDDAGFKAIDSNADGAVDEAEMKAAVDTGMLVAG